MPSSILASIPAHPLRQMAQKKSKKSEVIGPSTIPTPSLVREKLPAWYERVFRLVASRELESKNDWLSDGPYPEDFDEDISELESKSESEDSFACRCSSDASDCKCDPNEIDFTDEDPLYAEYKEMREERKRMLADLRKDQELTVEYHKAREDEVEKVWTEAEESRMEGIEGQELNLKPAHFRIYSSEYIRSLHLAYDHGISYVEFYAPYELDKRMDNTQFVGPVVGHIYFNGNNSPDLEAFEAPKRADLSGVSIGIQDSDANVTVKFIDRCFLKLVVPRHIAYPQSSPSGTPELLEFVGISKDFGNERKRKREDGSVVRCQKQREVSPRESWFEMNHPMGSWAQSRW